MQRWRARRAAEGVGQINLTVPVVHRGALHQLARCLCSGKSLSAAMKEIRGGEQPDPQILAAENETRIAWAALAGAREEADRLRAELSRVTAERDELATIRAGGTLETLRSENVAAPPVIRDERHG
jgi:hypothetical protein